MKRILALVEGQTEETFVRDVLSLHLQSFGLLTTPIIISTKRVKSGLKFKGGIGSYKQFKRDIQRLIYDRDAVAITMIVDYYGLPGDFPGMKQLPERQSCYERAEHLEEQLSSDLRDRRFIPYLSLHEFESLLLASPDHIAQTFSSTTVASRLSSMVDLVSSPEEVNDGPTTHPSARLNELLPTYKKRLHGPMIADRIGLDKIRRKCPHFDQWVNRLESLGTSGKT